ncbi:MAG: amidase family protein, partial [Polyangiaceae bacterium]|nr:amidase family protein [Polyangiaceae bacterium]
MVDPVFVEECKAHPILAVASTHAGGSRWKGLVDKLENIQEMSAVEFASAVISGDLSAVDVVSACLVRVRDCDSSLHAFVHLDEEGVFLQAENIDRKRARGVPLGPLAGVPIAIKDSICTVDAPTSCGSKLMGQGDLSWQSPYDAHCVDLLRRADAIVFGKTNLDEFSMGSSTQSGAFGGCRNPVVLDRVPGGSSGGSAVAVASRMVPAALGSDTGGSIRQPASFTSIVGIAPTYGRVSRYGLVAFGSGLDRVGPMAADVRGASRVLDVISGWDAKDATSSRCPAGGYELSCGGELDGIRVGVPVEYFEDGLDPEISRCVLSAVDALSSMGCRVESVSMPHTRYGSAAYCVLASAEASSNLARF